MNTSAAERSQAFATNGAARLKLSNIRGRVDIQPGAAGAITVTAVQHNPGRGTQVELTQAPDDTVSAVTRFTPSLLGWLGALGGQRPARVDYTVRVPPACSVELSIVEGQALVRGLTGDFELRTVSGRLHLADLSGGLRVHTVSGDVLGEGLRTTGAAYLSAVSGDITLADADLPAVTATTVSGRLRLQTGLSGGPYHFNSVAGDVYLLVPAGTHCAAALHSQSGRVHRSLPGTPPEGAEAGERPQVRLNSVSGDLWLVGPADAPEAPAPPARDRRDVLERVSRGELSVEEAAQFLKAP